MSLDFSLIVTKPTCVFEENITHNLTPMWHKAGVYEALYESDGKMAIDYLTQLQAGYMDMLTNKIEYVKLNPENGWGSYDAALAFLRSVISGIMEHPTGKISISR